MRWLAFDLIAPMASFGVAAPGGIRDTSLLPTRGALLGLFAAALGVRRTETERLATLSAAWRFASRVDTRASLLRDYHTAQAPKSAAMKKRPHATRRDELSVPKEYLNTVLSQRFYLCNYRAVVAAANLSGETDASEMAAALNAPRFLLYLGRKSCPLCWPLDPELIEAADVQAAFAERDRSRSELAGDWAKLKSARRVKFLPGEASATRTAWDVDLPVDASDPTAARKVVRRDDPIARSPWQFAEREQYETEEGRGP